MTECGNCGRQSPETFRFCPHCGSPLRVPAARAPAPPLTERKVVSVLFCDLVGFTARSDGADPEDVRAILEPFHRLARAEIERHGGTLDKFIGDAAMGVFGSPAAREDDPERAVRAALGIVHRIRDLNRARPDRSIDVRAGVETGDAIVTPGVGLHEGERVAGDVVNTASRLQSAAPTGTVLVGEATHRMTRGAFEFEELPPVTVKGKADPLRVWRALRPLRPPMTERRFATPFVGRERERRRLAEILDMVVRGPEIRLVTVLGEPGAGKSRLLAEFRSDAQRRDEPVAWLRGRCLSYGEGITFWALGEIVKELAGILESDPVEARDGKLALAVGPLGRDDAERAWMRARLSPLVGIESGPPVEREEAFAAWRRFLEAIALQHPTVLLIEDLHWADPALVAFLDEVVQGGAGPLLVVATARPELFERYPAWGGRPGATALALAPLSAEETARLASSVLGTTTLHDRTRALLVERSGGNPLYAEEFARMLFDRGLVDRRGLLTAALGELEFPETVQALIAARLDALAVERKVMLQDAAVIGTIFWTGAVAFLEQEREDVVREGLDDLEARQMLRPVSVSSIQGQTEHAFWHALVRDVAYGQIPRGLRARKHRQAAAWIERIGGQAQGDLAEILAHHATNALDLARASRQPDDLAELEALAARHLRHAGTYAMGLDVARAESHFRRALELTPHGDPDRPDLHAGLAEAAFHAGRLEEAQGLYEEAIAGFRSAGRPRPAADAMVRLSVVLEYRGEASAGRALLADAIGLLERGEPGPELARALATSTGSLMVGGRFPEGIAEAERAIGLAESVGEAGAAARARGLRGYARVLLGDLDGLQEQREALRTLLTLGVARAAAVAYNNLGSCLLHAEGPQAALDVLAEGATFAERRGLGETAMGIRSSMTTAMLELGEWDRGLAVAEEVEEEARRMGSGYDEVYAMADRAFVLATRQGGAAVDFCEAVLSRARSMDDSPILVWALVGAGTARAGAGDAEGAARLAREALQVTEGQHAINRASELPHLVRLAVGAGDLALGADLVAGLESARLERYRLARASAEAVLAEARRDLHAALEGFQEAVRRWDAWGNHLERAHALTGVGRCLATAGRADEAEASFTAALAAFARLGAEPAMSEARARLARLRSAC